MILFLDFDGVMHPFRCDVDRYFCNLGLIEDWLRRRPGIEIVISSSWRAVHPLGEMQCYFSHDIGDRVIGATPQLLKTAWEEVDRGQLFERELEIELWLRGSAEPWRPWVALDDMPWLFRPFHPKLVVCDGATGLTKAELESADRLLALG